MARKILKLTALSILGIIIILAFANPSLKQFKDYIGERSWKYYDITFKRTQNWLIYSTYEMTYTVNDKYYMEEDIDKTSQLNNLKGRYTGFFFNFSKK